MIAAYPSNSGSVGTVRLEAVEEKNSPTYRFQQDKGLSQQVAKEVVVSQSDTFKVTGRVDLM